MIYKIFALLIYCAYDISRFWYSPQRDNLHYIQDFSEDETIAMKPFFLLQAA